MKDGPLGSPDRLSIFGEPRLLTTVDELVAWERWHGIQMGFPRSDVVLGYFRRALEIRKERDGAVGLGLRFQDPAVFALFDRSTFISGGEINMTHTGSREKNVLPNSGYARIINDRTNKPYLNMGLNTQVTQARLEWARQHQVPWVEALIDFYRKPSLQVRLSTGFVINSFERTDFREERLSTIYPMSLEVRRKLGIRDHVPPDMGETIELDDPRELMPRLEREYGIVSERTNRQNDQLFVRMIPRDFGN